MRGGGGLRGLGRGREGEGMLEMKGELAGREEGEGGGTRANTGCFRMRRT